MSEPEQVGEPYGGQLYGGTNKYRYSGKDWNGSRTGFDSIIGFLGDS